MSITITLSKNHTPVAVGRMGEATVQYYTLTPRGLFQVAIQFRFLYYRWLSWRVVSVSEQLKWKEVFPPLSSVLAMCILVLP